jgi:hypothetical protein
MKPKRTLDLLGPQVEITNTRLAPDQWASNTLQAIGKTFKPDSEYLGSFATHLYKTRVGTTIFFAHQHTFPEGVPPEALISTAASDQAVHLMEVCFGRARPTTLDTRDKREKL